MTAEPLESPPVGLVLGSGLPPEDVPVAARLAEKLGFAEIWYAEDYFFSGGMTGAAAALDATRRIPVGLGVVSVLVRHPAVLAMEVATLSRLHPGRVRVGIGLGARDSIEQMGLRSLARLKEIETRAGALRRLLAGEGASAEDSELARIKLRHPPRERVPLYVGAMGPKMLRLSGAIADGTLLSWIKSRNYVRWARAQITAGAEEAGRYGAHRLVSLALFSVDSKTLDAKEAVRDAVVHELARGPSAITDADGISQELNEMLASGGRRRLERELRERWLDDLVIAGDPDECAAGVREHLDAGADAVALFPVPSDRAVGVILQAGQEVVSRLRGCNQGAHA